MFQPRRYQVTGIQPVLDHEPGSIFEADLEPVQEARLLASGALIRLAVESPDWPPPLDVEPPPNPEQQTEDGPRCTKEE